MKRIGIIGCGAIGSSIAQAIDRGEVPGATVGALYDQFPARAWGLDILLRRRPRVAATFAEFRRVPLHIVVEAASQQAARQYAGPILGRGRSLLLMSAGALLDTPWRERILRQAARAGATLTIPSGAIGGLDVLRSARGHIREFTLTTTKNPRSLGLISARRGVVYRGPARQAVKKYPANVNVAAALTLAANLEPRVTIIAKPGLTRNIHRVEARGDFGEIKLEFRNKPSQENPKTSALAMLSAVETLRGMGGTTLRVGT